MEYKEFGIYVEFSNNEEDATIVLITHVDEKYIFGIILTWICINTFNNYYINNWLLNNISKITTFNVIKIDANKHQAIFDDYGYIGQVLDLDIKNKLKKIVEEIPKNEQWLDEGWI